MAASAGAWYRVGKVNVTNDNQSVVGVDTNWQNDVIAIAIGDIFTLDAKTWYEVMAVNSDTSITLDRGFEGSTSTNKTYAIVRNTSGTILTRIAGQVSVQFNQKQLFLDELRTWLNSGNATEELTDSHGLKQSLKTPSQMVRDHDNKLAELDAINPHPYAMRKVEFEARRAANNEKFAASGFVHFGNSTSSPTVDIIKSGLSALVSSYWINQLALGYNEAGSSTPTLYSKTNHPVINIAGVTTNLRQLGRLPHEVGLSSVLLPPAEDGTRTYDSATGISVTHATSAIAFASETATNKVVTDRVDMWGFEAFLREINDDDPFVYANGLIQSQATNINGVATVSDNVRPITYFAWYDGDGDSRGRGVNWQTATESQRIPIASDPENNIYFDDATGKFYQWCGRGRSFAGAGNGDWETIAPLGSTALKFGSRSQLVPQGILDNTEPFVTAAALYLSEDWTHATAKPLKNGGAGVFSTRDVLYENINYPDDVCVDGECYFLPCGTVNRLNQGAYHPSFNPSGAAQWTLNTRGTRDWHNSLVAPYINEKVDAFSKSTDSETIGRYNGEVGTVSGRPDGRFYDAIYASGQGGVCRDMRYSAWGLTQEDFAEADLSVKSGEYRGREMLEFTYWVGEAKNTKSTIEVDDIYLDFDSDGEPELPTSIIDRVIRGGSSYTPMRGNVLTSIGVFKVAGVRLHPTLDRVYIKTEISASLVPVESVKLSLAEDTRTSIASEYTHTEVIGDPANILQCDDLKDGWVGSWNPSIPDGAVDNFRLSRPASNPWGTLSQTYTVDLGDTWAKDSVTLEDGINNEVGFPNMPEDQITIYQYSATAKVVEAAGSDEVYKGDSGVGGVFMSSRYILSTGGSLGFSLTGNVQVGNSEGASYLTSPLDSHAIYGNKLTSVRGGIQHKVLPLALEDVPAFKALNYNVVEAQQGFINYAYTELKYDSTAGDWGDDSKIHIADNQTTMLDTNGNTVKVGTARIVEPLGWIKNDK